MVVSCWLLNPPAGAVGARAQDEAQELEALLEEERGEADLLRRRGRIGEALVILKQHLREEPGDAGSRILRAACRMDRGEWKGAEADLRRALRDAPEGLAGLARRRVAGEGAETIP